MKREGGRRFIRDRIHSGSKFVRSRYGGATPAFYVFGRRLFGLGVVITLCFAPQPPNSQLLLIGNEGYDTILLSGLKVFGRKFREIGVRGEGFGDGHGNPVNVVFQGNTQIAFRAYYR